MLQARKSQQRQRLRNQSNVLDDYKSTRMLDRQPPKRLLWQLRHPDFRYLREDQHPGDPEAVVDLANVDQEGLAVMVPREVVTEEMMEETEGGSIEDETLRGVPAETIKAGASSHHLLRMTHSEVGIIVEVGEITGAEMTGVQEIWSAESGSPDDGLSTRMSRTGIPEWPWMTTWVVDGVEVRKRSARVWRPALQRRQRREW